MEHGAFPGRSLCCGLQRAAAVCSVTQRPPKLSHTAPSAPPPSTPPATTFCLSLPPRPVFCTPYQLLSLRPRRRDRVQDEDNASQQDKVSAFALYRPRTRFPGRMPLSRGVGALLKVRHRAPNPKPRHPHPRRRPVNFRILHPQIARMRSRLQPCFGKRISSLH